MFFIFSPHTPASAGYQFPPSADFEGLSDLYSVYKSTFFDGKINWSYWVLLVDFFDEI